MLLMKLIKLHLLIIINNSEPRVFYEVGRCILRLHLYETAKLFEKQYKIKQAVMAYKLVGILLGYDDATRLSNDKVLIDAQNNEKKRVIGDLLTVLK